MARRTSLTSLLYNAVRLSATGRSIRIRLIALIVVIALLAGAAGGATVELLRSGSGHAEGPTNLGGNLGGRLK